MKKTEFLELLSLELKRNNVADAADILEEYEQHFAFKLADGYTEEEIAAKLGEPRAIAAQYDALPATGSRGRKILTALGLGLADLCFGLFTVLLWAWEAVMAAFALGCAGAAVGLIGNIRASFFGLLPTLPWYCALLLGLAVAALAVLTAVGVRYFAAFLGQLLRAYCRFHHNALASADGCATLPPLTVYPQFRPQAKRRMKKLALLAVTVFALCFVLCFVVCALSAGTLEFWHAWGWFGHGA
ncbi:MAG: DUF1700 domain-containing protein [Oscillospiraceae bacterium]|nr:DUF1700 domain-containing protein [Oscillospiraceae bacterium]